MKFRILLVCLIVLTAASDRAFAWGADGHQLVGSIADKLLKPHAKQHVVQILGFTLRVAAPWPDCVRSVKRKTDGSFKYVSDPRFNAPCKSFEKKRGETKRMENYVSRNWSNCPAKPGHGCHESYHFADVEIQQDKYDRHFTGTNEHDIVSAIGAAILVLQGQLAPAPFSIRDKKEALFLLAHFIGDIHQPLHVGSVYLDPDGKLVDPDNHGPLVEATETAGGNFIAVKSTNLHSEWDDIPDILGTTAKKTMITKAKAVTPTTGEVGNFAATWASDTIVQSHAAFFGVTFSADGHDHWVANFADPHNYSTAMARLKIDQLAKGGARLAQLLNTIWP
jgi:hypothetical protein